MADRHARDIAQAEQSLRAGQVQAAESRLLRILKVHPRHPRAAELLGYITGNRGELERSFELLKIAVTAPETSGEAHYYLGKHHLDRGQFADAARAFETSLRLTGDFFEGLHDLGVALSGGGQMQAALDAYRRAQAINPKAEQVFYNQGVALDALKRFDEALAAYDQAIALNPGLAVAWDNRGATLNDLSRQTEALASHEKAIALAPDSFQAWSNRGVILASFKRMDEARECQQKALAINPAFAAAWGRLGAIWRDMKQPERALECLEKALALEPEIPYMRGDALYLKMQLCLWRGDILRPSSSLEDECAVVLSRIDAGHTVTTPFVSLSIPATRAQQLRSAAKFTQDRYFIPDARPVHAAGGKIRLGYFSADFRSHAVAFLTAGLLEAHDREHFEVHAFSLDTPTDDPMTARVRAGVDVFNDVEGLTDTDIAGRARELGIDIAIDLTGHTQGSHTGVFARRAAPVQVSYLGYPGTMGASFIDYLIADRIVVPQAHTADYAEKMVYMPDCFQVNDARRPQIVADARARHGLDDDTFVYCCFNNSYKVNQRMFEIWLNLLRRTDTSVLWLIGESEWQMDNLRHWARDKGVSPERLIFASRKPYAEHLARYQLADLVLDTLPFNGGATTSDALWGGAPVLTCLGDTYAGRMAASLLTSVGLAELITDTLEQYQEKASYLAHNSQQLREMKQRLSSQRGNLVLFDTNNFTAHIESAYTQMVQRSRAGLPPDHLWVLPLNAGSAEVSVAT